MEGATFFAPIFMLALGLEPEVAIGTGLLTEVFGFGSGPWAYWCKRLIDFKLGGALLVVTVPAAIAGTLAAGVFEAEVLKVILGVGLFAVATSFLRAPDHTEVARADKSIDEESGGARGETCVETSDGEFLPQRCRVPSRVAVATSVFVVAVSALTASIGHFIHFVRAGPETLELVWSLAFFTIPGVIIGGQIGPRLASRISQRSLECGLGILFIAVAILMLGEVARNH